MNYQELLSELNNLQKKAESLRPLDNRQTDELRNYYRIGLTWSSNALEGNSLTETETKVAIEDGLTAAGKPLRDYYEAIGHAEAYQQVYRMLDSDAITEDQICYLHRLFYRKIDEENAGTYRKTRVFISGSKYVPPKPDEVAGKMKKLIDDLGINPGLHPAEWVAQLHKEFVFIHPFVDGNVRIARLLMNLALLKSGYTVAIIPPVKRIEYIQALEDAHTNEITFLQFIAEAVYQSQLEFLRMMGR